MDSSFPAQGVVHYDPGFLLNCGDGIADKKPHRSLLFR